MAETYKYDAFISYRHAELDIKVAELLHTKLETFKTPKGYKKIERIFRDRDELPTSSNLAESILDALTNSKYLIVICSPRTTTSKWVLKEIETFRELHGNDRILSILIEGEPDEAFPESLRLVPFKSLDDSGNEKIEYEVIEPLAADIRDQSFKAMKRKLNTEILRLMAPIYGCNYDDLKQRQRKRRKHKSMIIAASITIATCFIGMFIYWQLHLVNVQNEKISINEKLLIKAIGRLDETSDQLIPPNDEDIISTLNNEGVYIGSNDLWLEGIPEDSFLISDFLTADFVISDLENKYIVTNETYDSVDFYNFKTRDLLFTLPYVKDNYTDVIFISDSNYVVVISDNTASLINLDTFVVENEYLNEDANTIVSSNNGSYLVDIDNYNETISLINPMTMTVINTYTNEDYGNSALFTQDNQYVFILNDESLLSIHLESGNSHIFPIDEYSNVAISNQQNIAAVIEDSSLIIYNYTTGIEIYHSEQFLSTVLSLSFNPKGNELFMSKENGSLISLNLKTYESKNIDSTIDTPISQYIYDKTGSYMVTWDEDSERAMIWDLDLMKEIAYVPYYFGISPDFKTVYGYEAFNLYGMNRESLENIFVSPTNN